MIERVNFTEEKDERMDQKNKLKYVVVMLIGNINLVWELRYLNFPDLKNDPFQRNGNGTGRMCGN